MASDFGFLQIGFAINLGIFAYKLANFLVRDIFIHQRFKLFRKVSNRSAIGARRFHKLYYKHLGKGEIECFRTLLAPFKYYK